MGCLLRCAELTTESGGLDVNPSLKTHPPGQQLPILLLLGSSRHSPHPCSPTRLSPWSLGSPINFLLEEIFKSCTSCLISPKPLQPDPADARSHDWRLGKKF